MEHEYGGLYFKKRFNPFIFSGLIRRLAGYVNDDKYGDVICLIPAWLSAQRDKSNSLLL
ncbi:hypothetical protein [Citrobacter sp. JGM124]|uniref:hypothetical protein n=1 Tax=Citrobacter sp. JGM124 TaxID=2799789 RepID=UPI001BA6EB7B|nr:hypothetical protein [Citrobacter sp. JGM124]MBS0847193.1 hypothetical protein [Citrobacter sp. JGM124]